MSLKSDLSIDASKFDRKLADKQTQEFNEKLIKIWADGPRWYEVQLPPARRLSVANRPRSAQKSTANFAGKAKHHFQSPSFLPKASTAQYHHANLVERFHTVCSNLLVALVKGSTSTFTVEDGCFSLNTSTFVAS
jgi:hypothetical protein